MTVSVDGQCPFVDIKVIMVAPRRGLKHAADAGPDRVDASRFTPTNRRRLSGPGLRTFLAIADLWGLTEEQRRLVLGLPSRSTYHNWVKAVREHGEITLAVDTLHRISAVLGIHQASGHPLRDRA